MPIARINMIHWTDWPKSRQRILVWVRSIEYGYDIGSNRTSVTTESGTTTYTYDERNRLDLVKQNGVLAADYDYDAISNLTQTTFGNGTRENRSYTLHA